MIYGYGKFEHQAIDLSDSKLQVIYGENEAGKSTIMSFIHSILFGFPSKQQTENRYQPKKGTAYGGYLVIRTEDHKLIKVERLPGKAGGEVGIEVDDTVQGEEYLQTILSGIDRETYRAIFSFDIHGLQQIQKMNSDQIGKFLFLSSIYGAEALFTIENTLLKQQELLFKPSGKRPIINEALLKLKESNEKLVDAKRKNNEYQLLLNMRTDLEKQLSSIVYSKKEYDTKQRELEKIQSILPLVRERNWCLEQLKLLPDTSIFPEDGLKQLDQLIVTLQPLEAQLHSLKSKHHQDQLEEEELVVNQDVLQLLPSIQTLREQLPLYKEKQNRNNQKEQRLEQLNQEVTIFKQRLLPHLTDEEISIIPATIPIKESIKKVLSEDQHLKQRKKMLDDQFDQIKNLVEETEWKMAELNNEQLSDHVRGSLEDEIAKREALNPTLQKAEYQKNVAEIQRRRKEHKQEKKQRSLLFGGIALFLLIGSGWFFVDQNWLFVFLLFIGFVLALLQLKRVVTVEDPLIVHLSSKIKTLEKDIASLESNGSDYRSLSELMLLLEKDNKTKQALHHEQLLHKQHERTYDRILKLYEEWEDDQFRSKEETVRLAKLLQVDQQSTPEALVEAHELIQHIQQLILKKQQEIKELQVTEQEQDQYEKVVNQAMVACTLKLDSVEEAVYEINKRCSLEVEKHDRLRKVKQRKKETEETMNELTDKVDYLQNEKNQLLNHIGVENEEDFRKYANIHQHRQELLKQKMWVERQLATGDNHKLDDLQSEEYENIEEQLIELEREIKQAENCEQELQHELSSVVVKIQDIEQNGTYSKLLHGFEAEKTVVKEFAEQWVVKALAKDLLNQTVERYRKDRLPALLAHIEKYFNKLTSTKYIRVFLPENKQSFIVERADGINFFAEELSQATAEQLYLSIRLALVKTINEQVNLPIIIDDSFVHFDHQRTANMLQVLQELKQENQVIYFTCHEHIAKEFKIGKFNKSL